MIQRVLEALKGHRNFRYAAITTLTLFVGLAIVLPKLFTSFRPDGEILRFHTVGREPLSFSLVERGLLESQSDVKIVSKVEDIRGDGIQGNAIVWMVANGSMVKQGDLLVIIDSGTHVERVDEQIIQTDQAEASHLEAKVLYENQISINKTFAEQAKLQVKLAELELEMFKHPDKGTYRLEVDAIKRLIDDTENELLQARAQLQLSTNDKEGLEQLFRMGYSGKSELDRVRLNFLQAQSAVDAKMNRLRTHVANLTKKDVFDRKVSLLTLEGALNTARQKESQVELDNSAELAKAKAELDRADRMLAKERELLARYKLHLDYCKIYAPQDGMVAYAVMDRGEGKIELGTTVWEGQQIMSLPDLTHMQVATAVHETSRNRVHLGMKAAVRLEAFQGRSYGGTVTRVDLMPDQRGWDESNTKVYKTIVRIDEEVSELKPGMTAIVEFHVANLADALTVPVQAVQYVDQETFCYLDAPGGLERRAVKLGISAQDMVQITEGVRAGERVVVNPGAINP